MNAQKTSIVAEMSGRPPDVATGYAGLLSLLAGQRFSELRDAATAFLVRHPDHGMAYKLLGLACLVLGDGAAALSALQHADRLLPENGEVLDYLGCAWNMLGCYPDAAAVFERSQVVDPGRAESWVNIGKNRRDMGDVEGAVAAYRQAIALQHGLISAHNNLAGLLCEIGRPAEALALLDRTLLLVPDAAWVHIIRGNALKEMARFSDAVTAYDRALQIAPDLSAGWNNLADALQLSGDIVQAVAAAERALALNPDDPEVMNTLGTLYAIANRPQAAEIMLRRALAIHPGSAVYWLNLGNALAGDDEKVSCLKKAFALQRAAEQAQHGADEALSRPAKAIRTAYAEALINLGNSCQRQARYSDAESAYRQALEVIPSHLEAQCYLGAVLMAQGRLAAAETAYRRALQRQPDYVVALNNLAQLLIAQGSPVPALGYIKRALVLADGPETRTQFMHCINHLPVTHYDDAVRAIMIRALTEHWGLVGSVGRVGSEMVKRNLLAAGIGDLSSAGTAARRLAEPSVRTLMPHELAVAATDELFSALLCAVQLPDRELECFLGFARQSLLAAATNVDGEAGGDVNEASIAPFLRFYSALAQQCFINEYVFSVTDHEAALATALRDAVNLNLATGRPVPALTLFAVAAYFPLYTLGAAERLLAAEWPAEVDAVVRQQLREPRLEMSLAATIPRLTPIDDAVSLKVQQQYSENPYPRWVRSELVFRPREVNQFIRISFPHADFRPLQITGPLEVMVAGCGTGQHPIGTARRFSNVRVLAVDLSLPSLCYAKRKAQETGVESIEFAQADILKLGTLGRTFDLIESAGVLHHLASIEEGLRILLSLLRADGLMALALYSKTARRNITRARAFIADRGVGTSADDIRRCRQELVAFDEHEDLRFVTRQSDFFGMSTCRDLLFHVQETCIDLPELKALLARNGLQFLGFEIDATVKNAYLQRYPEDPAAIDLENWHRYEQDNPYAFVGMYQFWVQKSAGGPAPSRNADR